MKRASRLKLLQFVIFILEIYLLFLLGDTAGIFPPLFGARPTLLIGAALAISLTGAGELSAMSFGVFCGLLLDFSHGGPYGFYALILACTCYISASLTTNFLQKNLLTALLMTLFVIVLVFALQWLFFYLLAGYSSPGYAFVHHMLPAAAYSFVASVPVYVLIRATASLFQRR